jgi:hypothetical protein
MSTNIVPAILQELMIVAKELQALVPSGQILVIHPLLESREPLLVFERLHRARNLE